MAYTDINSEDRLMQATFAEHLEVPIEERVAALLDAIEVTEASLRGLGFEPLSLLGAKGFARIQGLADAGNAVYTSDESKRRSEILARVVSGRFKALLIEPSALVFAERHDNIEAIYKKLSERRDTADVSALIAHDRAASHCQSGDCHAGIRHGSGKWSDD